VKCSYRIKQIFTINKLSYTAICWLLYLLIVLSHVLSHLYVYRHYKMTYITMTFITHSYFVRVYQFICTYSLHINAKCGKSR